jgi:hypothetical protein
MITFTRQALTLVEYRTEYQALTDLIASTLPWYRRPFYRLARYLEEV